MLSENIFFYALSFTQICVFHLWHAAHVRLLICQKEPKKEAGEFMNKHGVNERVETTEENSLSESCGSLLVRP